MLNKLITLCLLSILFSSNVAFGQQRGLRCPDCQCEDSGSVIPSQNIRACFWNYCDTIYFEKDSLNSILFIGGSYCGYNFSWLQNGITVAETKYFSDSVNTNISEPGIYTFIATHNVSSDLPYSHEFKFFEIGPDSSYVLNEKGDTIYNINQPIDEIDTIPHTMIYLPNGNIIYNDLNIEVFLDEHPLHLAIYNQQGVLTHQITNLTGNGFDYFNIPFSDKPKGIYFIQSSGTYSHSTIKVIKL